MQRMCVRVRVRASCEGRGSDADDDSVVLLMGAKGRVPDEGKGLSGHCAAAATNRGEEGREEKMR